MKGKVLYSIRGRKWSESVRPPAPLHYDLLGEDRDSKVRKISHKRRGSSYLLVHFSGKDRRQDHYLFILKKGKR